jgi:flagellar basal body-associated protein FliL
MVCLSVCLSLQEAEGKTGRSQEVMIVMMIIMMMILMVMVMIMMVMIQ